MAKAFGYKITRHAELHRVVATQLRNQWAKKAVEEHEWWPLPTDPSIEERVAMKNKDLKHISREELEEKFRKLDQEKLKGNG